MTRQSPNSLPGAAIGNLNGGFGTRALGPWGENAIKAFVHEAIDEALKLEAAVARLRVEQKVVLMHNGRVSIASAPAGGASIRVVLPTV